MLTADANAPVDKLLDEQNALIDNAERTALMIQVQQFFALNKTFTGYEITPSWIWDAFAKNIRKR